MDSLSTPKFVCNQIEVRQIVKKKWRNRFEPIWCIQCEDFLCQMIFEKSALLSSFNLKHPQISGLSWISFVWKSTAIGMVLDFFWFDQIPLNDSKDIFWLNWAFFCQKKMLEFIHNFLRKFPTPPRGQIHNQLYIYWY